jgi:hypothetical protein
MSTKLSLTVGIFAPGATPKFSTRTIVFTDLDDAFDLLTSILTNPPLSRLLPVPEPDPEPFVPV